MLAIDIRGACENGSHARLSLRTFRFFFLKFFIFLFCVSRLSCACLTRCLMHRLGLIAVRLILRIVTDSYDGNARINMCLNHCLGFETFEKSFDPRLVAIHSVGEVADGGG